MIRSLAPPPSPHGSNDGNNYASPGTPGFQPGTLDTSAPVVTLPVSETATEGESASLNLGSFTDDDSGSTSSHWVAIINWNDGSALQFIPELTYPTDGDLGSLSHTFAAYGTYNPSVTVVDQAGNADSASFQVAVADAPLTVTAEYRAVANESFTLVPVATLTDVAGADSNIGNLSATINWGDGNTVTVTSTPSANGQIVATATAGVYTVEGSHTYTASGSYSVTVSAVDVGGSRATSSALPGTATVGNGVWVAGNWVDVTNPGARSPSATR